jgi:hypothetical protein
MVTPIRPEDLLPDDQNVADLGGVRIRKGSAGAFVQNVQALAQVEPGSVEEAAILDQARVIGENLKAIGFFDVFSLRDERLAAALDLS